MQQYTITVNSAASQPIFKLTDLTKVIFFLKRTARKKTKQMNKQLKPTKPLQCYLKL